MYTSTNKTVKNWKQNTHHVDIWIGPTETNNGEVVDCEKALTPKQASGVIREPGVGYEVVGMCVYIYIILRILRSEGRT